MWKLEVMCGKNIPELFLLLLFPGKEKSVKGYKQGSMKLNNPLRQTYKLKDRTKVKRQRGITVG